MFLSLGKILLDIQYPWTVSKIFNSYQGGWVCSSFHRTLSELVVFRLSFHSHFFLKIIGFYGIRWRHISELHKSCKLKVVFSSRVNHSQESCLVQGFFSYNYHRSAFHSNCMIKFHLTNRFFFVTANLWWIQIILEIFTEKISVAM